MEQIIERVKSIILSPKDALTTVKTEEMPLADTMKNYVAILAAIPAIAHFIGFALVGIPLVGRQNFGRSLIFALISYVMSLVAVIVFAKIVNALAPTFNAVKSDTNSFKVAIYSFTPIWVAGAFNMIPSLAVLALLGSLYGIYVVYLALPILMETPEEKTVAYTVVSLVVAILVFIVIGFIANALAWGGGVGPVRYF